MILRPFVPSDAPLILSWLPDEVAFRKWSADRYGDYPIPPEAMVENYVNSAALGPFYPLTAEEDGTPVGHLIIRRTDAEAKIFRFGFIVVDAEQRGRGLGRQMLTLALSLAREKLGAAKVTIGVFENNPPAIRCYTSLGFVPSESPAYTDYALLGETWRCLELEKTLDLA